MNKFNLPVLWIWILVAVWTATYTHFTANSKTAFETQSVRTTRSLWLWEKIDTKKDYCNVIFNPQSPTIDQPFTVTVNWKVTNATTIKSFVQWPNSWWWWTNNFSWFPLIITESFNVPWTYVYTFTIKWDSMIQCEWKITIWKRIGIDQPTSVWPVVDPIPTAKPGASNDIWTLNPKNSNGEQPRTLRQ
jgi:hypothetical protein